MNRNCLHKFVPLLLAAVLAAKPVPAADDTYNELNTVFQALPHRLAGSTNFNLAFEALAAALRNGGLEPEVLTHDTLVPEVVECVMEIDGKPVTPFYAVNTGVAPLHFDSGNCRIIYGGNGRWRYIDHKDLDGAIVLLDAESERPALKYIFPLGASAVILLGGPGMSQWQLADVFQEGPAQIPLFYMQRETAQTYGLLEESLPRARIRAQIKLSDQVAKTLWIRLPATEDSAFKLGAPETMLLSATLDTYGLVPQFCPDSRRAANAALLADVLLQLNEQTRKRDIIGVFWGSHFFAQDAARHFYYAVAKRDEDPLGRDSLQERLLSQQAELSKMRQLMDTLSQDNLFSNSDADARDCNTRIKRKLTGYVNDINARLRDLRIEQLELRRNEVDTVKADRMDDVINQLDAEKSRWNNLRQQQSNRQLEQDPESLKVYALAINTVSNDLTVRINELQRMNTHTESMLKLQQALGNRIIVGHFDFDFARADRPWLASMAGGAELFTERAVNPGSYLLHFEALGKISATSPPSPAPYLEAAINPYFKPFSLSVPIQRSVPSAVSLALGQAGFQLMSVGENLQHDQMPVRSTVDLQPLSDGLTALFATMSVTDDFSLRRPLIEARAEPRLTYRYRSGEDYQGLRCVDFSRGSSDVEDAAARAVMCLKSSRSAGALAGISRSAVARINREGYVFIPMISRGATADPANTRIMAFGYDREGRLERYSLQNTGFNTGRIPLFYGFGGAMFSYGFAPDLLGSELYQPRTIDARTEGIPKNFFQGGLSEMQTYATDRQGRFKQIGGQGQLLLGSSPEYPKGQGIPLDPFVMLRFDGIRQGAYDYWHLNESRLGVLRSRNIINDALEQLHADAKEHLETAELAEGERHWSLARAHHIIATCLENRVYAPLRAITDDLVKAVVVLLLLNIPFAFALERLLCGFTSVYKQVLGFAGFFLGTFALLFITHPAFSLAQAPIVIFLAFVIILLGAITLYIVLSKIKQEIRAIQGMASTVHGVENDSNTVLAAILIGISGMRNRPLKTFLTAVTVILLTFTILVFASFTAQVGVVESYLGSGQNEDRIELHRFSYLDIPEELLDAIKEGFGKDFVSYRRGALFMNPTRKMDQGLTPLSADRVLYNPANGNTAPLGALLGIDPAETLQAERLGSIAGPLNTESIHPPIYLPAATAERLQALPGSKILLNGIPYTYSGTNNTEAMQTVTTINNTRIVPPDFQTTVRNMGKQAGEGAGAAELEDIDIGSFAWFSNEQVAITRLDALQNRHPNVNLFFMTLYPRSGDVNIERAARQLARIFQGAVFVKSSEGAKRMFFTRAIAGSGFMDVIVPLILGGLIIFSSLMGSIVDREREIFTYSALGLSPSSVGALFFAESAVYSVVGGMGGYLLGQTVARILVFMGEKGIFTPPDLNFSSLASVLTILIVMAVVMLSTIYPAIKAGKAASPGVARKWRMPAPKGDRLDFVFPFTVSETDFTGIISFIREHFENHGDATLGAFAARNVKLFSQKRPNGDTGLGISAEISLAPFDLGVFQHFRMYSQEFEIKGIDEVVVEIQRFGGSPQAWVRGNRVFADELRRQFLLWRSLPIDTVEHYRGLTRKTLGDIATNA